MEKNDLISVIVPVYNVESYLEKCIDSLLCQTYTNIEIILVNDGSTDGCRAICDAYAKNDNRIRVIHQENTGVSAARNAALNIMKGQWVMFVDSDDWVFPDFCKKAYHSAVENEVLCVAFGYECVYYDNHIKQVFTSNPRVLTSKEAIVSLFSYNVDSVQNMVCNKLFNISVFKDVRFPLNRRMEDVAVVYQLLHNSGKVYLIGDVLYSYNFQRPGNYSSLRWSHKNLSDRFFVYNKCLEFVNMNYPDMKEKCLEEFAQNICVWLGYVDWKNDKELKNQLLGFLKDNRKEILETDYKQHKRLSLFCNCYPGFIVYIWWKQRKMKYLSVE